MAISTGHRRSINSEVTYHDYYNAAYRAHRKTVDESAKFPKASFQFMFVTNLKRELKSSNVKTHLNFPLATRE